MKKTFILVLFLFGIGMMPVSAQNPIPSFNVPVYYAANFQEQLKSSHSNHMPMGKRMVVMTAKGSPTSIATVYVYSLDYQDILGPFTLNGGETVSVEIDSREWGVFAESDDHIWVDVWINDNAKKPAGIGRY